MKPIQLSALGTLILLPAFNSILPSYALPSGMCTNYPSTRAGDLLNVPPINPGSKAAPRDVLHHPRHSTRTVRWCAEGTTTYIIIILTTSIPGTAVPTLLAQAYNSIATHVSETGDGLVPSGNFGIIGNGLALHVWRKPWSQISWAVLRQALGAVADYMGGTKQGGHYGEAKFWIFDGNEEVGEGIIET